MKEIINTDKAPTPLGPYNQAILTNGTLYISGQIAINIVSGDIVLNSIEEETAQVMLNLEAILTAAKMTFENVVKASIFITNMDDFGKINGVYARYFKEETAPSRETVQVAKLPKNVHIEISMIAQI